MQINIEQRPKTFIVVNPVAGMARPETIREKIESSFRVREIPFEIYETKGNDNFRQIIRDAIQRGFKLVIAAGGDGTVCIWPRNPKSGRPIQATHMAAICSRRKGG